jgi:hypothetical protein
METRFDVHPFPARDVTDHAAGVDRSVGLKGQLAGGWVALVTILERGLEGAKFLGVHGSSRGEVGLARSL